MIVKSSIPASWRLLQTIDAFLQLADEMLLARRYKTFRLCHVHILPELSIEKSCSDVYLVQFQSLLNRQCNEGMNRFQSRYRRESLVIVCSKFLRESLGN